jgi:hypothetical protein
MKKTFKAWVWVNARGVPQLTTLSWTKALAKMSIPHDAESVGDAEAMGYKLKRIELRSP